MELKFFLLISVFFIDINCQFGIKQTINQTQYLQQIEKYGASITNLLGLVNSTSHNPNSNATLGWQDNHAGYNTASRGSFNASTGSHYESFNATERFLNKTMSSMAKGFCVKEVPTISLLKSNEVVVAGNGSSPSLSIIQVCCEGYQRNIHNFRKCDPICSTECVNGFCSAPDVCLCYPDHIRNLGGYCVPTCPIMCLNGFCNNDNTCTCKEGFVLDQSAKFCTPKCSNCQNGNCTAPEECSCNKGFHLSPNGKCEHYCSQGCQNGDCVAPDVCNCHRGYSMVNDVCEPVCSRGCLNGFCTAPDTCECAGNGWSLDPSRTQCIASCDRPCLNGVCTGPNQCTCRSGYGSDNFDPFRCVPRCDPPCLNGVCSGPGLCLCYQGYIKDRSIKGSQTCVKV